MTRDELINKCIDAIKITQQQIHECLGLKEVADITREDFGDFAHEYRENKCDATVLANLYTDMSNFSWTLDLLLNLESWFANRYPERQIHERIIATILDSAEKQNDIFISQTHALNKIDSDGTSIPIRLPDIITIHKVTNPFKGKQGGIVGYYKGDYNAAEILKILLNKEVL